jgi:hypothetical protein
MEKEADKVGFWSFSKPVDPWPLDDVQGMRAAVAVLQKSLKLGLDGATVQFATTRMARATLTLLHQTCAGGTGNIVGAHDKRRLWISDVPTHSFWFS